MSDVETAIEHNKNIFVRDSDAVMIKEAEIVTKHLIYWPKCTNARQGQGSNWGCAHRRVV